MGRETKQRGIQPLSFILFPPMQLYCMNKAAHIPYAAPFSFFCYLSLFLLLLFFIILYVLLELNMICFFSI